MSRRDANQSTLPVGRRQCSDREAAARGFSDPASAQRRRVLAGTIAAFESDGPAYRRAAQLNLEHVADASTPSSLLVEVHADDWGAVAGSMTRRFGQCFAVLNMANAQVPGGAYVEGAPAQEENMFRRTDCHFSISPTDFDTRTELYTPHMVDLLSAKDGHVYLDCHRPRICIRGAESRDRTDLGYDWLPAEQIFPFYEMRAAAQDLRQGAPFDVNEARRRIAAQFETLCAANVRHVILSAFGCGAFCNPAEEIARLYRGEIARRRQDFQVIAFAVFNPGYGPDNWRAFSEAMGSL